MTIKREETLKKISQTHKEERERVAGLYYIAQRNAAG